MPREELESRTDFINAVTGEVAGSPSELPIDMTTFNHPLTPEEACPPPAVDGMSEVTILIEARYANGDEAKEVVIKVPVEELDNDGTFNPGRLDQGLMQDILDDYNVCYLYNDYWAEADSSGWNNIVWIEDCDEWGWSDDCCFGILDGSGNEGYFSIDGDYVRCTDSDECYITPEVATVHDVYWCESCEEYRSGDDHDFDECENGGSDENHFDNTISYQVQGMSLHKKWGTDSPVYSMTNGMRHTFGVEMETRRGYLDDWRDLNVKAVYDGSTSGNEYVTGVLRGDYGFNHLKKICDRISQDHELNSACGVHVHIGGQFNRRFTIMLLILGYHLQDELYRMMPPSRVNNTYCKKIPTWASEVNFQNFREVLGKYIYGGNESHLDKNRNKKCRHDHYCSTRYRWININNFSTNSGKPTVEFRLHGASTNYEKIRNWTLICMAIVGFAENYQKYIWQNRKFIDNQPVITLKYVLDSMLGDNISKQVYDYYKKRCKKFAGYYGEQDSNGPSLPSSLLSRNGVIE